MIDISTLKRKVSKTNSEIDSILRVLLPPNLVYFLRPLFTRFTTRTQTKLPPPPSGTRGVLTYKTKHHQEVSNSREDLHSSIASSSQRILGLGSSTHSVKVVFIWLNLHGHKKACKSSYFFHMGLPLWHKWAATTVAHLLAIRQSTYISLHKYQYMHNFYHNLFRLKINSLLGV